MTDRIALLRSYIESATGRPLETFRPQPLSGWSAVEALWPLNDRFRPVLALIKAIRYEPRFEREADAAIAGLTHQPPDDWAEVSPGAWRVLLERQQQGIMVALANEHAGNTLMSIPVGLSPSQRTVVVALFLLYQMPLPWPPDDRSGLELPIGDPPESLRPH